MKHPQCEGIYPKMKEYHLDPPSRLLADKLKRINFGPILATCVRHRRDNRPVFYRLSQFQLATSPCDENASPPPPFFDVASNIRVIYITLTQRAFMPFIAFKLTRPHSPKPSRLSFFSTVREFLCVNIICEAALPWLNFWL